MGVRKLRLVGSVALGLLLASGAGAEVITPDGEVQQKVQEALILAGEGDTIEFAEGTFEFTMGLSLDVNNVTVKGQGMDKTILSFKNQDAGAEGLTVTSDGVVLEDFAIEDTNGDAIKVKGAEGISFLNVRTEWTGGPKETNGAYGLYPVESTNVLVDGCVAIGASDAGIYVGQSKNVIVRNSRAEYNVAGIEIENCYYADVYDCVATHNTGGILVFDLPNLPQQGGHHVRVFNNKVVDNDTLNFAPEGNIVGNVPTGTGIMIMANRNVEVFENEIGGNQTANIMISAYFNQDLSPADDPDYYMWPEAIHIHHNDIGDGGNKPEGMVGQLVAGLVGTPIPDITWDGRINPEIAEDGTLPADRGIYIHDNGDATFVNMNIEAVMGGEEGAEPLRNLEAHKGSLPSLDPVTIPGDMQKQTD